MLELRTPVEAEAWNAENLELHGQYIALFAAAWVITGRLAYSADFTVWKGRSVEARGLLCVLVEPKTDRIFRLHVALLDDPFTPSR